MALKQKMAPPDGYAGYPSAEMDDELRADASAALGNSSNPDGAAAPVSPEAGGGSDPSNAVIEALRILQMYVSAAEQKGDPTAGPMKEHLIGFVQTLAQSGGEGQMSQTPENPARMQNPEDMPEDREDDGEPKGEDMGGWGESGEMPQSRKPAKKTMQSRMIPLA